MLAFLGQARIGSELFAGHEDIAVDDVLYNRRSLLVMSLRITGLAYRAVALAFENLGSAALEGAGVEGLDRFVHGDVDALG